MARVQEFYEEFYASAYPLDGSVNGGIVSVADMPNTASEYYQMDIAAKIKIAEDTVESLTIKSRNIEHQLVDATADLQELRRIFRSAFVKTPVQECGRILTLSDKQDYVFCACGSEIKRKSFYMHIKTNKHKQFLQNR